MQDYDLPKIAIDELIRLSKQGGSPIEDRPEFHILLGGAPDHGRRQDARPHHQARQELASEVRAHSLTRTVTLLSGPHGTP